MTSGIRGTNRNILAARDRWPVSFIAKRTARTTDMRLARVRLHYGSIVTGYIFAAALPVLMALARQRLGPANSVFPFIYFYPAIWAVAYFRGPAPGIAAILFSALSAALVPSVAHPARLNWFALACIGAVTVAIASALRATREAAADATRAILRFRLVTENMT